MASTSLRLDTNMVARIDSHLRSAKAQRLRLSSRSEVIRLAVETYLADSLLAEGDETVLRTVGRELDSIVGAAYAAQASIGHAVRAKRNTNANQ